MMMMVFVLLYIGCLKLVQFRGSFLMTGRYHCPQHCDLTCDKSVLYTMYMANKSTANKLNVHTLVLVLKSLQSSHHDFKDHV